MGGRRSHVRHDVLGEAQRVTAFWMQVERRGGDECWLWTGYVDKGYGRCFDGRRMVGAHELAVTYTTGERRLPELDTCHSCHVPLCCNPRHLRFDTRQSNVDDAIRAGRHTRGERNGHSRLTEDDVIAIRRRTAAGAIGSDLARQYGVSGASISFIIHGQRWAHAAGPIQPTK